MIKKYLPIVTILIVVGICFYPVLNAGFLKWDDEIHLLYNSSVRGLDLNHIQSIFTEND